MKKADPHHPVHELITARWSPYGFSDKPVAATDLSSLFEAARWAASSYNEQPWRFIVATQQQPDEFQRALSCLVEANQAWAAKAPVLVLCCTSTRFSRNDKPNRCAEHDVGLAAGNICLEATARGLFVHQMAGVDLDKVRETYGLPDGYEPVTAMAIGYRAELDELPEPMRERDAAPRERKPLGEIVFTGSWGNAAGL